MLILEYIIMIKEKHTFVDSINKWQFVDVVGQKLSVNKKFISSGCKVSTALPNHVFLNFVNVTGYSSMKPKKLN
tara:strand:+ start:266 stop:487 length:222 start_codon:yes stop_codon:yes gene_type:complete